MEEKPLTRRHESWKTYLLLADFAKTMRQTDEELNGKYAEKARHILNAIPKARVQALSNVLKRIRKDDLGAGIDKDVIYILEHLKKGDLPNRVYVPKNFAPEVLASGEIAVYAALETYLHGVQESIARAENTIPLNRKQYKQQFYKELKEVLGEKRKDGYRGLHLLEETLLRMLLDFDRKTFSAVQQIDKTFEFFKSIATSGDDLDIIINKYDSKLLPREFSTYLLVQGFEGYVKQPRQWGKTG
jgi:hypothetical protein